MFTSKLNDKDFLDAFGITQDDDAINPEELASSMPTNYNQLAQEEALSQTMPEVGMPADYMSSAQEEALNQTRPAPVVPRARKPQASENALMGDTLLGGNLNFADLISKATIPTQASQTNPTEPQDSQTRPKDPALTKSEQLIAEYQKMLGEDQQNLKEARSRDRMLKVGGGIGDALATYLNAKSQMNVKAPGVQIQQGAGLGKVADMFATSPEIASDITQKREAMMKQYAELAKGERSQAQLDAQKEMAKGVDLRTRELARDENETKLRAAGIKASGKASGKGEQPSFEEKEKIKASVKEQFQVGKENRELKKQLEPAIATVDDQIKNVKDAISLINKSKISGTGPLDQYFASITPEGQLLKKSLGNIQLDTLVTKFQGMSRAVDTETDRKFFQETQPNMGNFETTNKKMLGDILKRLEGVKERSENKLKEISSQKEETQPVETQQQKATNLVKIKGPSGQEATMTEEKAQKYLSKPGYTRIK